MLIVSAENVPQLVFFSDKNVMFRIDTYIFKDFFRLIHRCNKRLQRLSFFKINPFAVLSTLIRLINLTRNVKKHFVARTRDWLTQT